MECPDSWLNMIPGCVSEGVHSQRRLTFESMGPPQCGGAKSCSQSTENLKRTKRRRKAEVADRLGWDINLLCLQ